MDTSNVKIKDVTTTSWLGQYKVTFQATRTLREDATCNFLRRSRVDRAPSEEAFRSGPKSGHKHYMYHSPFMSAGSSLRNSRKSVCHVLSVLKNGDRSSRGFATDGIPTCSWFHRCETYCHKEVLHLCACMYEGEMFFVCFFKHADKLFWRYFGGLENDL